MPRTTSRPLPPGTRGGFPYHGSLKTALAGNNNDLVFTAKRFGKASSGIRVRYVVSGNNTALSVSVSGKDITVNVATDGGGAATSTATQVRTAVNASTSAAALVGASNAPGNDGTDVVAAMAYTALSKGGDYVYGTGR